MTVICQSFKNFPTTFLNKTVHCSPLLIPVICTSEEFMVENFVAEWLFYQNHPDNESRCKMLFLLKSINSSFGKMRNQNYINSDFSLWQNALFLYLTFYSWVTKTLHIKLTQFRHCIASSGVPSKSSMRGKNMRNSPKFNLPRLDSAIWKVTHATNKLKIIMMTMTTSCFCYSETETCPAPLTRDLNMIEMQVSKTLFIWILK